MVQEKDLHAKVASLIGKETVFHASEEISKAIIRRFAATMGDFNPLYWDEEYAKKSRYGGIVAPPTLIFELTHDIRGEIGEDGLYEGFEKWTGLPMNIQRVGNEYEIFQPVRPDDIITCRRKVTDVTEKQGKQGKWLFVISEVTYTNQRGELLGIDRETFASRLPET